MFVEHYITRDGKSVSGTCNQLSIDFPTYHFDGDKQVLRYSNIHSTHATDTSFLIYGSGLSLTDDAGSGAASGLKSIGDIPFTDGAVTINSMGVDGTIVVTYKGTPLTIPPGTSWADTIRERETDGEDCRLDITEVDRITNFGFLLPYQFMPWY